MKPNSTNTFTYIMAKSIIYIVNNNAYYELKMIVILPRNLSPINQNRFLKLPLCCCNICPTSCCA